MQDLDAVALLQDPARRALYEFVVARGREVSRNEAAEAVGMQRTLAAFHLDRLASAGLLDVAYRRLTARSGPGAGRPAKVYWRAVTERAVAVPPRNYARAAKLFADAIERSGAEATLFEIAREQGVTLGRALAKPAQGATVGHGLAKQAMARKSETFGEQASEESNVTLGELEQNLAERGYEPYHAPDGEVRLRNCPFHVLAQAFPVVACGMNLALFEGLLSGADLDGAYAARLDPCPGECCVVIASKTNED